MPEFMQDFVISQLTKEASFAMVAPWQAKCPLKEVNMSMKLFLTAVLFLSYVPLVHADEAIDSATFDALLATAQSVGQPSRFAELSGQLWGKFVKAVREDQVRINEHQLKSMQYKDKTMRYSMTVKGDMPPHGYPLYIALHGGGQTSSWVNDSQWEAMKTYYSSSVNNGIYVATRGVADTWNLHFMDESYTLYDRLIENLVALENVDPDRVYILGFSAGGDGVYQITPRMADRFAAANMSAGHHNWIKFDNLYNTPFLIQVGQSDGAYKRNTVAVENFVELNRLAQLRGGYTHELFLHYQGSHNNWRDNDPSGANQTIVVNPEAWLHGGNSEVVDKNTNAIRWLDQFSRNPHPPKIYWDPATDAPREVNSGAAYLQDATLKSLLSLPRRLFYWLDLGVNPGSAPQGLIEASYDKGGNEFALNLPATISRIRVLLHYDMVDFHREFSVKVNGAAVARVNRQGDLRVMTRTLLERGDSAYIFQDEIIVEKTDDGQWTVK